MDNFKIEHDILHLAVDALAAGPGLVLKIAKDKFADIHAPRYDVAFEAPGAYTLHAVVKRWAPQANLDVLIQRIHNLPEYGILVADYVNPNMAKELKKRGVQFIDTVGNAFINLPSTYVYVTGGKPETLPRTQETGRAFGAAGLKVLFALLCEPELIGKPYRDIAAVAGVALGNIAWIFNDLIAAGFLVDDGRKGNRKVIQQDKLLNRWVEQYPGKLKRTLYIGDFVCDKPRWWEVLDINAYQAYWGAEVAAEKLTHYLKPKTAIIYLPVTQVNTFLANEKFHKASEQENGRAGLLKLYKPFWPLEDINTSNTVHPILIYADLLTTGDPRNIETANIIYDKHIAQLIREN